MKQEHPHTVGTRLEAIEIARSVLDLFESAYPGDLRPRFALPVGEEYVKGIADRAALRTAFEIAEAAAQDAAANAEGCAIAEVPRYWAAADAAETVAGCLAETLDLRAVQQAAESAMKYAMEQ